jgi:hypothetical protein
MKAVSCFCFALSISTSALAQESIDEIVKQRIALLTEIHQSIRNSFDVGAATDEQVRSATIDLYSFRRDAAKSLSERLQWQERIIASERERKVAIEQQAKQGTAAPVETLRAAERVLAAQQKLLELKTVK